jgi:hypothetical protein
MELSVNFSLAIIEEWRIYHFAFEITHADQLLLRLIRLQHIERKDRIDL